MVKPESETIARKLYSANNDSILEALRSIKNDVIGNSFKKKMYGIKLEIAPRLVDLFISDDWSPQIQRYSAEVLSSILFNKDCYDHILASSNEGLFDILIKALNKDSDIYLKHAITRSIYLIVEDQNFVPHTDSNLKSLCGSLSCILTAAIKVDVLSAQQQQVVVHSINILEKLCSNKFCQFYLLSLNIIPLVLDFVDFPNLKITTAALNALAALAYEDPSVVAILLSKDNEYTEKIIGNISKFLEKIKSDNAELQIATCKFLARINRIWKDNLNVQQIVVTIIPVIIKMIERDTKYKLSAVETLALLCRENEEMQKAASDAKLINKLIQQIPSVEKNQQNELADTEYFIDLQQMLFFAISEIISNNEESRMLAVNENMIAIIERAMRHKSHKVKSSACLLARYLARSARIIQTKMSDSKLLALLIDLFDDPSDDVRIMASGVLPNILLDYSPMRQSAIDKGVITKLSLMLNEDNLEIKKNLLWSFKNLLSMANSTIKQKVMNELTYYRLETYLKDPNDDIKEQAVNILRNLVCSTVEDIKTTINAFGSKNIQTLLVELLKSQNEHILLHTLYTITNIAIGNEEHKNLIVFSDALMLAISSFLLSSSDEIRIACLWCIINLSWDDQENSTGLKSRIEVLKAFGVLESVQNMLEDSNLDIRDRASVVIAQISA